MGNQLGCKRNHSLKKVDFKNSGPEYYCDLCKEEKRGHDGRFRCISGCDFDVCLSCMKPHLTDGQVRPAYSKDTTLLTSRPAEGKPNPQSRLKHPHYVASVTYKCDECGDKKKGDRLHCPADLYDICHDCVTKKILLRQGEGGGSDQEISSMSIEPTPFAEGASREAYKADVKMKSGRKVKYVVKGWKPVFFNQGFDMEENVRIHIKAHELAKEFNEALQTNHPVIFRRPSVHTMSETYVRNGRKVFMKGEKVMLEPFIYGEYDKFTSNNGWSAKMHSVPDAFTHFTWHKTKELIVCDLQGNRQVSGDKNDAYYLTDPAICSLEEGKWGLTDIGKEGIVGFFENHKCNQLCKGWDIPQQMIRSVKSPSICRSTSYAPRRQPSTTKSGTDSENVNHLLAALLLAALQHDSD